VTWCGDEECDDAGAWDVACCCLHTSGLCSVSLCVLEGLRVFLSVLGIHFGPWILVCICFLNAGCCKCVGHPELAMCCCCCLHLCVGAFVFLLRAFSLVCGIFWRCFRC